MNPSEVDPDQAQRISEAAARAALGQQVKTYEAVPADWRGIGRLAMIFVGLLVVTAFGFAVRIELIEAAMYLALIVGIGVVFSTASGLYYGRRNAGGRLDLFEDGLVFTLKERQQVVRYDSTAVIQDLIAHQRNGVTRRVTQAYEMRDVDGQPLRLREGIADVQEWGPRIQEAVALHQMPAALATLGAGHPVEFGSITLNPTGVAAHGTLVSWAEITDVEVGDGRFRIKTAPGRSAIATNISSLTNFSLLYALIKHGRGIQN